MEDTDPPFELQAPKDKLRVYLTGSIGAVVTYRWFSLSRNEKINRTLFSG